MLGTIIVTSKQSDKYRRRMSFRLKASNALNTLRSKRPHGGGSSSQEHVSERFPQLGQTAFLLAAGFLRTELCLAAGRFTTSFRTIHDLRLFSALRVLRPGHHNIQVGAKYNGAHTSTRVSWETKAQDPRSTAARAEC